MTWAGLGWLGRAAAAPRAVGAGTRPHQAPKAPIEGRQVAKAGVEGDCRDRLVRPAQAHGGAVEARTQHDIGVASCRPAAGRYAGNDTGWLPPRARGRRARAGRSRARRASIRRSAAVMRRSSRRLGHRPAPLLPASASATAPARRSESSSSAAPSPSSRAASASAISGMSAGSGGRCGSVNAVRRAPGTAATTVSRYSGVKWKARQRSPVPCSWPHSKQVPALPSSRAPGASTALPSRERYWNVPLRHRGDADVLVLLLERPVLRTGAADDVAHAPAQARRQHMQGGSHRRSLAIFPKRRRAAGP